jgi:hypothetical protein
MVLIEVFIPASDICSRPYKKQTTWPLVRKRNIPTDRPPLVDEI